MSGEDPTTWAIICCLPRCALAGRWNQEQSWNLNPGSPIWDEDILRSSLNHYARQLTPAHFLSVDLSWGLLSDTLLNLHISTGDSYPLTPKPSCVDSLMSIYKFMPLVPTFLLSCLYVTLNEIRDSLSFNACVYEHETICVPQISQVAVWYSMIPQSTQKHVPEHVLLP